MRTSMKLLTLLANGGVSAPAAPTNLAVTGAVAGITSDATPEFTWDAVTGATTYRIQYNTAADPSGATEVTSATNSYAVSSDIALGDWFVRVRAENAGGNSAYTDWLSFEIVLDVQAFTQSRSSGLLANPDFSSWTGDNPNSWTVTGESGSDPMVTEVASGGGAGTGAARFYSSATNNQPQVSQAGVLTNPSLTEFELDISARTSGTINPYRGTNAIRPNGISGAIAVAGEFRGLDNPTITSAGLAASTAPTDLTINTMQEYTITPNATYDVGDVGFFELKFTLPASPVRRECVLLQYRYQDVSNHFRIYLFRRDANDNWDIRLEKVVSGTVTILRSVNGIGACDTLRLEMSGNDHQMYSGVSGTFTARGLVVTDSALASNHLIRALYSSTVTPTHLRAATSFLA